MLKIQIGVSKIKQFDQDRKKKLFFLFFGGEDEVTVPIFGSGIFFRIKKVSSLAV